MRSRIQLACTVMSPASRTTDSATSGGWKNYHVSGEHCKTIKWLHKKENSGNTSIAALSEIFTKFTCWDLTFKYLINKMFQEFIWLWSTFQRMLRPTSTVHTPTVQSCFDVSHWHYGKCQIGLCRLLHILHIHSEVHRFSQIHFILRRSKYFP
jgi:hypothetical protein